MGGHPLQDVPATFLQRPHFVGRGHPFFVILRVGTLVAVSARDIPAMSQFHSSFLGLDHPLQDDPATSLQRPHFVGRGHPLQDVPATSLQCPHFVGRGHPFFVVLRVGTSVAVSACAIPAMSQNNCLFFVLGHPLLYEPATSLQRPCIAGRDIRFSMSMRHSCNVPILHIQFRMSPQHPYNVPFADIRQVDIADIPWTFRDIVCCVGSRASRKHFIVTLTSSHNRLRE
jgi:hypothetical protein